MNPPNSESTGMRDGAKTCLTPLVTARVRVVRTGRVQGRGIKPVRGCGKTRGEDEVGRHAPKGPQWKDPNTRALLSFKDPSRSISGQLHSFSFEIAANMVSVDWSVLG